MDELDRSTLINHLADLRALELARDKILSTLKKNNAKIRNLGYSGTFHKPSLKPAFIIPSVITLGMIIMLVVINTIEEGGKFTVDKKVIPLYASIILGTVIVGAILFVIMFSSSVSNLKKYNESVENDRLRVENEIKIRNSLANENYAAQNKLAEVNKLLSETYSLNIIPQQFRNIQGVCYLYDYISTSQQSLESAFLNYNVNQINIKMDQVITQQSEMILQQYITNSRLKAVEAHNIKMINQLESIQANSAEAARQAAITATHAKAITFFEGYNFFKNN